MAVTYLFGLIEKVKIRDDQLRMRGLDYSDLERHIDITSDFGTRAADSDDIGGRVLKRVNRGARQQTIVERRAHHRKRRASVDERLAYQHSVDHCF